jgi:hypothetical protein
LGEDTSTFILECTEQTWERAHLYDTYWTHHAATEQCFELEWPDQYKSAARSTPRFR